MRLALAQINTTVGALDANTKKIMDVIERVRTECADLIVFPELAISGYPPEDLLLKKRFVDMHSKKINQIRRTVGDETVVLGMVDHCKKKDVFNAAAIIHDKHVCAIYHKHSLPNYGVFDERRYFVEGKENYIFKKGSTCFGVSICEDIWGERRICKEQVQAGAQILINISASPYHMGKRNMRKKILRSCAQELNVFVVYLNLVGGQDELVFDGGSFIFDNKGVVRAAGKQFEEDIILCDLDVDVLPQRRTKGVRGVKTVLMKYKDKDNKHVLPKCMPRSLRRHEEIYQALVLGTRDYVTKNGFKKVVIGISGGVDSALTTAIACDAIGVEHVVGISMPSMNSSKGTQQDAQRLAEYLGIQLFTVPIESIYQSFIKSLHQAFKGLKSNVAEENIQARIRGTLLMAFSNKFGWLVLTTGNKSETAVGYCTLYGDMAGGFAVLKDVSKTLVYELVEYRNSLQRTKLIPLSIIRRAPSAELRNNQKDQDTLPPYSLLDKVLELYIENDETYETIVARKGNQGAIQKILRMVDINEYKRRQAPPGVKITPKSFGRDRRLPITNHYLK